MKMRSVIAAGAITAIAGIAPAAASAAASAPLSLALSPTSAAAGSTTSFTTDLTFNSSNSVRDITLHLPPGLLANANVDGGKCLTEPGNTASNSSYKPDPNCQVGTGTVQVTYSPLGIGLLKLSIPLSIYLVAPPTPGTDLAGLQIEGDLPVLGASPLGPPGAVDVSAVDASVTATFHQVPNTLPLSGLPPQLTAIVVDQLSTTLTGTRVPTNCAAAPVTATADFYPSGGGATSATQNLGVTGCGSLPLTPKFTVTATRDAADSGVQVVSELQQPAAPPQAVARTTALTLPGTVLAPNVMAVLTGGILCASPPTPANPTTSCPSVGTAVSTSPLYPTPLTGAAYLTGTLTAPQIELVFPYPFPLTLEGAVNIATGTTTFSNIPDLPLTDLKVTLNGGPNSVFTATCAPSSGTASATLTAQAGAPQVTVQDPFTVTGCSSSPGTSVPPPPSSGPSPGSGPGSGSSKGGSSPSKGLIVGAPRISALSLGGLGHGAVTLRLSVDAGHNAPRLRGLTIALPQGIGLRHAKTRGHKLLTAVYVNGKRVKAVRFVLGRLVLTVSKPASVVNVRITDLWESSALEHKAKRHKVKSLRVVVATADAKGHPTVLSVLTRKLSL